MAGSYDEKSLYGVRSSGGDLDTSEFEELIRDGSNTQLVDLIQPTTSSLNETRAIFNSESTRTISECSLGSIAYLTESAARDDASSSEELSCTSDGDVWSILGQLNSTPDASPVTSHLGTVQSGVWYGASPVEQTSNLAQHSNKRSSPFKIDSGRSKRWSTGMFAPASILSGSQHIHQAQDRFSLYGSQAGCPDAQLRTTHSTGNSSLLTQDILRSYTHHFQPIRTNEQTSQYGVPHPLPSQEPLGVSRSNTKKSHGCTRHFTDHFDPPDLYSSLHDEPSDPPDSDMHPAEPDLTPHEQDTRFSGDLYTPHWVRGHGNKREGWCGLCKPGRWLVLKNSAFWYDKSFSHGVSHATGVAFQRPQKTRRAEENMDIWEGLCGSCGDWIALVSSKKKGTTWFRHAYKVRYMAPRYCR